MNIVFMGTPTFALPALDALAAEFDIKAVYTRPDAASHRGKTLLPSLVKARALELGIPVHTPVSYYASLEDGSPLFDTHGQRVVNSDLLGQIHAYEPDVIVVSAYGLMLPQEVLDIPLAGCVNAHASLLPRWRGAAPIQRAILAGDKEVGVSIMRMEAGMDTGPYCAATATCAKDKTYQDLIIEMGEKGARLLVETLPSIVDGSAVWVEQELRQVTYADKIVKGSIDLDEQLTTTENLNRVRASSHHERCRSEFYGRPVMILSARLASAEEQETDQKGLYVACADGFIEVTELKPAGKREMSGRAFKAGIRP